MQIPCPACRKVNEIRNVDDAECVRCGCDLSTLVAVTQAAQWDLSEAAKRLRSGNAEDALAFAERSWQLKFSLPAARLAALAAAASGDIALLVQWRRRLEALEQDASGGVSASEP